MQQKYQSHYIYSDMQQKYQSHQAQQPKGQDAAEYWILVSRMNLFDAAFCGEMG